MTINYKKLGKKIKNLRLEKGFSQEQLAEACELSTSYISYIETGKKKINFSQLEKLSKTLDFVIDIKAKNIKNEIDISKFLSNCSSGERKILYKFVCLVKTELEVY